MRRFAKLAVVLAALAGAVAALRVGRDGTDRVELAGPPAPPVRVWRPPVPPPVEVIGTAPASPKLSLHLGESRDFAVAANGADLHYGWTLDGQPAGSGPRWTFTPTVDELGTRHVEAVITANGVHEHVGWDVRVWPGRQPAILEARPEGDAMTTVARTPVRLALAAAPASPSDRVIVRWTVDGTPVGEGKRFTFRPEHAGTVHVRARASGELGGAVERDWTVNVAEPPRPPVQTARVPEPSAPPVQTARIPEPPPPPVQTARAPEAAPRPAVPRAPEPPPQVAETPPAPPTVPAVKVDTPPAPRPQPARVAATVPPTVALASRGRTAGPAGGAPSTPQEDARRLLERYAAAWRAHDVDALRALGQVQSERAAEGLRRYFAQVEDLSVEVDLVAVRSDGERTVVEFTRRDRFRDPMGRLVEKESPPIEKEVVRTPNGLRFAGDHG